MNGPALTADLERDIVERIRRVVEPERVIVFGSAATGTMTPDSDIDLLVLTRGPVDERGCSVGIWRELADLERPFDVIVMASERFERTKHLVGSIALPAHREGRTIHGGA